MAHEKKDDQNDEHGYGDEFRAHISSPVFKKMTFLITSDIPWMRSRKAVTGITVLADTGGGPKVLQDVSQVAQESLAKSAP